jgi:tetratricopeptide (TPR) repeat protein
MKRFALPFLSILAVFAPSVFAQASSSPQAQNVSTSAQATNAQPAMTPQQLAELRANILMARKMYPEAAASYEQLVKQEPKNAELLNRLGVACEMLRNKGCAEKYFKKAAKADKTYASPYNNIGTVEYDKKHYKNAIKWYGKCLKLRMDAPATVYMNLGYAYFADKQYPLAMNSFQHAIAINPRIFQEAGSFGQVVEDRSTPDPGLFYFFVARTYAQIGNAEQAAHYLKIARDDGYKNYMSAKTDPTFVKVIKDPRVQEVFAPVPELAQKPH